MKIKLFAFLSIFFSIESYAQNYQTVEEVNDACSQLGFAGDEEAEIAVDNILDQIGVPRNFTIQECPNINNAVAKNIVNSAGLKERYILYDADFFINMDSKAGNNWAAKSILAHEIGHHLSGHALNNQGSTHEFELQADYFSGNALARLGATLEESQSAINTLKYEKATSTHPAKADRLAEIERGWNRANGITKIKTTEEENEEKALEFYRKGEIAYQNYNYKEAIAYFNKSKDLDFVDAYYYLASCYRWGLGVLIDYKEAFKMAKIGYELGSIPATFQMGTFLSDGIGIEKNKEEADRMFNKSYQINWFKSEYKKNKQPYYAYAIGTMYKFGYGGLKEDNEIAVIWFRQSAELGSPQGQNMLGAMYQNGELFVENAEKAFHWYSKAAENNYSIAQFNIGVNYRDGFGVEQNYNKAFDWFNKAAKQNYSPAQNELGKIYENPKSEKYDNEKALQWYIKSAENGYHYGQYNLGTFYYYGIVIEKDFENAAFWLKKSAKQENGDAQNLLGEIYYYGGYGVEKDYKKAVDWYKKSSKNGITIAKTSLGYMYEKGFGVEINHIEAFLKYKEAGLEGDVTAMYNVGYFYHKGYGVYKNEEKAIEWYIIAAKNGSEKAQNNLRRREITWD